MEYYSNCNTGEEIFFHGSKKGIEGRIEPKSEGATDFGCCFYLGTNEAQTLARVSNEPHPWAYQFRISSQFINEDNTLTLSDDDWMYFVLYNRGKLEDIKDTAFYDKYAHLADGKDFIIGPIADDVYDMCLDYFSKSMITDWTFKQLIDCFDYGLQVAAKSQRACDCLDKVSEKALTKQERLEIKSNIKMTRKERVALFHEKVAELNSKRKGRYFFEIKKQIKMQEESKEVLKCSVQQTKKQIKETEDFKNIRFPNKIRESEETEYGLF